MRHHIFISGDRDDPMMELKDDHRPGMPRGVSVLSDFDGTITLIDSAEYLLEHHADGDWRAIEGMLMEGRITIEECMRMQFEMISIPRDVMLRELDAVILPRPGLHDLLTRCAANNATFTITSAGLDFYIRHFMASVGWSSVEIVAPAVTDEAGRVRFRFPPRTNASARNFKEDRVLRERADGRLTAYIGDGISDLWAALSADLAFAVRGPRLHSELERCGKRHGAFTDLREVADVLFSEDHFPAMSSSAPEFMQ